MLNDSGIEIDDKFLQSFLNESEELLNEMKQFMSDFKGPSDHQCFEQYGQKVDRIMEAAYTLALNEVGDLAKFGKEIGFKASHIDDVGKLLTIHSLLSQLQKTLEAVMKGFRKGNRPNPSDLSPLITRLTAAKKQLS